LFSFEIVWTELHFLSHIQDRLKERNCLVSHRNDMDLAMSKRVWNQQIQLE